jgi:hypothetical protein
MTSSQKQWPQEDKILYQILCPAQTERGSAARGLPQKKIILIVPAKRIN